MAAIKLSLLLIAATIGLVLSTVFTFILAAEVDAPASESTQTDATQAKVEEMWKSVQNEYYVPKEMNKKLIELKKILDASALTEEMDDIKNQVNALIMAAEFHENQCNDMKIYELVTDITTGQSPVKPLEIYERHWKGHFLFRCTVIIADRMMNTMSRKYAVGHTHAILRFLPELFEAVAKSRKMSVCDQRSDLRPDFSNINHYRQELNAALYSYLYKAWNQRSRIGERDDAPTNFPLYHYYKDYVTGPCKSWLEASAEVREIYNYVNQHIRDTDAYDMNEWVSAAYLCHYIYLNDDKVYRDLEKMQEDREGPSSATAKVFFISRQKD